MIVKVMRLGSATRDVRLPDGAGANVGHALEGAGLASEGHTLTLNGQGCGKDTALQDGDIVAMVSKVEGGW